MAAATVRALALAGLAWLAAAPAGAAGPPAARGLTRKACALAFPHQRTVEVGDRAELARALAEARPGDLILLADGAYRGQFVAAASGSEAAPIVLCGQRGAVLDAGSVEHGYGLHVTGSHWIFAGFKVTRAKKGIMLDGASHNLLADLEVADIGNEGIHLRAFSSDNVVRDCEIHDTGKSGSPHYGEGVYVGSAKNHWCDASACGPDRSDGNQIIDNTIGDTTAESVDIKEGTTGGVLRGNQFSGAGMVADGGADRWVDVKGNGWRIEGNRGVGAPRDGFDVHEKVPGWGRGNLFAGNLADVRGPGFGIKIAGGADNVVLCDNVAKEARGGLSNLPCVAAPAHGRPPGSSAAAHVPDRAR